MRDLIGLKLLHNYDPNPVITETELIESRWNELDGKRICSRVHLFWLIHKFEFVCNRF